MEEEEQKRKRKRIGCIHFNALATVFVSGFLFTSLPTLVKYHRVGHDVIELSAHRNDNGFESCSSVAGVRSTHVKRVGM